MRIRIFHEMHYRYDVAPSSVIQTLRLTPRNHEGQFVVDWRIDVSHDCRLQAHEDAFGNIVHTFTAEGPLSELTVLVEGEVETQVVHGIVRGAVERFPASLYLRETSLTRADAALAEFARKTRGAQPGDPLSLLHQLLNRVHAEVVHDPDPARVATTAAEAFALRRGVCQDLTHVFIAAARALGTPARYVAGYWLDGGEIAPRQAGHGWAEAFVPNLGWVAFDPANGICATDAHVRVAIGLDSFGAAPVRGARHGGGGERLSVAVQVEQAAQQMQN
jgi:transglutaminase-like putative cysteine protease